jgi:hypothetical protein
MKKGRSTVAFGPDGDGLVDEICAFLDEIGLATSFSDVEHETFLPGIAIVGGEMWIDIDKLIWPGDLLHEAGHLALVPARLRGMTSGEVLIEGETPQTVEAAAMAWSYAAAIRLDIDPQIIFHPGGYQGNAEGLLLSFSLGVLPGLNLLERLELAYGPITAADLDADPFPVMQKWLRD